MYRDKRIICIIPARGGSRRLPGKNIKLLHGTPLIAYAIHAAKDSRYVDRVIVSTDNKEIARIASEEGAEVPFIRPAKLASDETPMVPVLQHAVREAGEDNCEWILLIQPTSPGVRGEDVNAVIEKMGEAGTHSCITVSEITDRPEWMYRRGKDGRLTPYSDSAYRSQDIQSQDLPKLYRINGAIYAVERAMLMTGNVLIDKTNCSSVLMPRERSIDIDTPLDFAIAEALFKNK